MSTPRPEARQHQRFNVDLEAKVSLGDRIIPTRTRDISRSGLCLVSPERVEAGAEVAIDLVLAFGDNAFSEPLSLQARVVWCTPLFGAHQVGTMFLGLEGEHERFLEMFLRFLDGTVAPDGTPIEEDESDEAPEEDKDDPFRP